MNTVLLAKKLLILAKKLLKADWEAPIYDEVAREATSMAIELYGELESPEYDSFLLPSGKFLGTIRPDNEVGNKVWRNRGSYHYGVAANLKDIIDPDNDLSIGHELSKALMLATGFIRCSVSPNEIHLEMYTKPTAKQYDAIEKEVISGRKFDIDAFKGTSSGFKCFYLESFEDLEQVKKYYGF